MKQAFSISRMGRIMCGTALVLVIAACTEKEPVLQGVREPIRPEETVKVENETRAIKLAKQTKNKSWPQSHGTAQFRTAHPALSQAPDEVWSVSIGTGDERRQRITAQPVIGDGRIYTLDSGGKVAAVSPSGQLLWQSDITLQMTPKVKPLVAGSPLMTVLSTSLPVLAS